MINRGTISLTGGWLRILFLHFISLMQFSSAWCICILWAVDPIIFFWSGQRTLLNLCLNFGTFRSFRANQLITFDPFRKLFWERFVWWCCCCCSCCCWDCWMVWTYNCDKKYRLNYRLNGIVFLINENCYIKN